MMSLGCFRSDSHFFYGNHIEFCRYRITFIFPNNIVFRILKLLKKIKKLRAIYYTGQQMRGGGGIKAVVQVGVVFKVIFYAESKSGHRIGPSRQGFEIFEIK